MKRGAVILITGTALLTLVGCASQGELAIRAKPTGLAPGQQPVSFRVAEARAHFALGNVALALEGFRKALREEPASVDAMNGLAACYDRMGRFDLSRRYYEQALAVAPGDARLYANLALSLDLQGRRNEAAAVRAEMADRLAAGRVATAALAETGEAEISERIAAREEPVLSASPVVAEAGALAAAAARVEVSATFSFEEPAPVAAPEVRTAQVQARPAPPLPDPPPPANAVSMALAPVKPAPSPKMADGGVSQPSPGTSRDPAPAQGPRIERLSMGEVALVTKGPIRWKPRLAERPGTALAHSAVRRPAVVRLTLLNAARSQGLAARTRGMLQGNGWSRVAIGNAPRVQRSSVIYYPRNRRADALRLASQFGFSMRHRPGGDDRLIVYLGRDAARMMVRPKA